jgi:DNA-binding transcriptional ArsR family regulator
VSDDAFEAETPEQFKALAHPFRQRLLFALGERPATISQLAAGLDARKGNVAHHLKVLREAGLVREAGTRTVRGGTERYFARAAARLITPGGVPGTATALLQAVATELERGTGEPLLTLRHVRLSADQAARLAEALEKIVAAAPDAPDEPRHGLLVALYKQAEPAPDIDAGSGAVSA